MLKPNTPRYKATDAEIDQLVEGVAITQAAMKKMAEKGIPLPTQRAIFQSAIQLIDHKLKEADDAKV